MPQLHVLTGDGQERTVDLGERPVSFGRADENDVVLAEQKASRRHCTFRGQRGAWRVVDEQSSNGTWLGGKPVLSARLQSGDEVEIGDTIITFVAQPSEMPKPDLARPRRVRTIRMPWEALVLSIGVAVAAWFGLGALQAEQWARETSAWKRMAVAEIGRASLGRDEAAFRSSLTRIASDMRARPNGGDAALIIDGAIARGLPAPEVDTRKPEWQRTLELLDAARARTTAGERRSRLRDILSRNTGDPKASEAVAAVLRADETASRELGTAEAARLLTDADKAVAEGRFAHAIEDWAAWLAVAPDVSKDEERAVAKRMSEAREKARLDAGVALAQYEEQLKDGRVTGANSLADAAMDRLRGTGWDAWLAARTRRFDRGGDAGGTPVAGGPRESDAARTKRFAKEKLDRAMRSADALALRRRYTDAAAALNEVAGDVTDASLQASLRGRVEDLSAAADVVSKLLAQARDDPKSFGSVPVQGNAQGRVTGATDTAFVLGDAKGANPQPVGVDALLSTAFVALLEKAKLEPTSFVPAALLLREMGETAGYTAWMRKALAVETIRLDASAVHARTLGAQLPTGGYVPHPTDGKSILTYDEMKRIQNAGKITALMEQLAKVCEKIDATKQAKSLAPVRAAYVKLEAARQHALELIFDEVKYFYPYRNRMKEYVPVQREVDERVRVVREAWDDATVAKVRIDATIDKLLKQADDLSVEVSFLGGEPAPLMDRVEAVRRYLGKDLTVQSWFETPADATLLEYNDAMLTYNAKLKGVINDNEREQVRITNEYRRMFGHRRILRLHEKLVLSAHGHSDDMGKLGFFDHFSPVEGKKTPWDRMTLAGYPNSPCSENIHAGSGDPNGAHEGWIHSSGHHRNILMPNWSEMGTGQSGKFWTQNFGFAMGDEQAGGAGPQ
ncbi:MAG: FHA domain-containing protein [Planctomycetes bacterium]|nr:FHA domain-containing protein [Planctomycetota bacterium]